VRVVFVTTAFVAQAQYHFHLAHLAGTFVTGAKDLSDGAHDSRAAEKEQQMEEKCEKHVERINAHII